MDTFGQLFLTTLWIFLLFAFLLVLFHVFGDIFRDHTLSGWAKAIWVILLIIFPPITALVYLIARGKGMQEREAAAVQEGQRAQDQYIQQVASRTDPAEQIAKAQQLKEQGVIDEAEFQRLKVKALG